MASPVLSTSLGATRRGKAELIASVFQKENSVTVIESVKTTGVSVNGKPWTSFRNDRELTFSWKRGPVRVYEKKRVEPYGRRTRSYMSHLVDGTAENLERTFRWENNPMHHAAFPDGFVTLMQSEFSPLERIKQSYPLWESVMFQSGLTPYLTSQNPTELARRILGKNYQKTVARSLGDVMTNHPRSRAAHSTKMVMIFSGIVPTDWIPRVIEGTIFDQGYNPPFHNRGDLRTYRALLKTATETQLRRITTHDLHLLSPVMRDIIMDLEGLPEEERRLEAHTFTSMWDLHQQFIEAHNRRYRENRQAFSSRARKSYDIEYADKALDFVKEYDGFTVVAPENSATLREWSDYMNNCISGYDGAAAEGRTLLYGVNAGDKLIANIELDPATGNVKQLLGKYNQSLPEEMSTKIKTAIQQTWPEATVDSGWQ